MKNVSKEDLRINLLTRVQGHNGWKAITFKKNKVPSFVRSALDELDAMIFE